MKNCIYYIFVSAAIAMSTVVTSVTATNAACSAYPVCHELKLTGNCCPSPAGVTLDCCKGIKPVQTCSMNAKCAALGLSGNCCPTNAGVTLDCCTLAPPPVTPKQPTRKPTKAPVPVIQKPPTRKPTKAPVPVIQKPPTRKPTKAPVRPRLCSKIPKCKALGLAGNCCPTNTGVTLDCCK